MTKVINKSKNTHKVLLFAAVLASVLFIGHCATFHHGYNMKGSILKQKGNEYYICIGTKDGAKEGQVYNVYSYHERRTDADTSNYLQREYIGAIKITRIVFEHYAKAVLVSGRAGMHDIVELK